MGQSLDTIDAPPDTTSFCMPEPGERFPPDGFPPDGLPGERRRRRSRWSNYDPDKWVFQGGRRIPRNPNDHKLWQDPVAAYLKENRGFGKVGQ